MVGSARKGMPSWLEAAIATRKMELDNNMVKNISLGKRYSKPKISDADLSFGEMAFSTAGDALISAIIVNPLDVAKLRRRILSGIGDEASLPSVLGVNFCAGFVAGGSVAAARAFLYRCSHPTTNRGNWEITQVKHALHYRQWTEYSSWEEIAYF